jgi:hypothetical protein
MVSHEELAKQFVNGSTQGKASRMFIEGDTIYSYGHHFPLAKRLNQNTFLLNVDKYSSSTTHHQTYMNRALVRMSVIECSTNIIKAVVDGMPIIISNKVRLDSIGACFENIKQILINEGLQRAPIKRWEEEVEKWRVMKKI